MHQDVYKIRLSVVAMVIALGFGLLAARLYQIQILRHSDLYAKARAQYSTGKTVQGTRGLIFDVHGTPLAGNLACRDVYAEPKKFEGKLRDATNVLSRRLGLPRAEVAEKLAQAFRPNSPRVEVVVARQVDLRVAEDTADELAALKIKGIRLEESYKRYYPKDSLLANALGFIGGNGKGDSGVEKAFDKELQPTTSRNRYLVDRKGRPIPFTETEETPRNGSNVYLTIDEAVQQIVESELKLMVDKFHPKAAYAVMADPRTGAILAMAQLPTYNPNNRKTMSPDAFRNRVLEDAFEPGSVMKGVTITGVLDWGLSTLDEKIFCENGLWWYAGKSLRDSGHRYGWLQTREVVQVSSNIGTAKLAIRLGSKRMYELLRRFGFGERTGLNLGVESPGILPALNKWSGLSIARLPIGQGISVTPLQMVQAYCAIANNGFMPQLHILDRTEDPETRMFERKKWDARRRVVTNDKAIADVTEALQRVTHEGGTAPKAAVKGYEVAGKTGTAQKVVGGQYSNSAFVASFIGFVPAENPAFVLLVVADEPDRRVAYYGGTVAAPTFSRIAEQTLRYLTNAPAKPGAAPPDAAPTPPAATQPETEHDADFTPDAPGVP